MKTMKTLLLGTAIAAVSSAAFAHDNYKTQLDNLNTAWECQDHFERGADIAGTIDEFEFCVWHLNNDRKGFLRNDMFYDILPTGNVIAIKKNDLTSKDKANKAIKTIIQKIIDEDLKESYENQLKEQNKMINGLEDEVDALEVKLTDVAKNLDIEDPAAAIADITKITNAIDSLKEALELANDGITQDNLDEIRDLLNPALEIKQETAKDAVNEVLKLTVTLGIIQSEINEFFKLNKVENKEELQMLIDGLAAERDDLNNRINAIKDDLSAHGITLNESAIDDLYNTAKQAGIDSVDITSDNEAVRVAAYDAGFAAGANSVDITSDNMTAFLAGVASVDITTDNAVAYDDGFAAGVASVNVEVEVTFTDDLGDTITRLINADTAASVLAEVRSAGYQNGIAYGYTLGVDSVDTQSFFDAGVASVNTHHSVDIHILNDRQTLKSGETLHSSYIVTKSGEIEIQLEDTINTLFEDARTAALTNAPTANEVVVPVLTGADTNPIYYNITDNATGEYNTYTKYALIEVDGERFGAFKLKDLGGSGENLEDYLTEAELDEFATQLAKDAARAYTAGYRHGYDDGYKDGYVDGFKDGVNSVTQ